MYNLPFNADPILFIGGMLFLWLAYLSYFDLDRLWRIYSMDRRWRERNPERDAQWEHKTRRYGILFIGMGLGALILSVVAAA